MSTPSNPKVVGDDVATRYDLLRVVNQMVCKQPELGRAAYEQGQLDALKTLGLHMDKLRTTYKGDAGKLEAAIAGIILQIAVLVIAQGEKKNHDRRGN